MSHPPRKDLCRGSRVPSTRHPGQGEFACDAGNFGIYRCFVLNKPLPARSAYYLARNHSDPEQERQDLASLQAQARRRVNLEVTCPDRGWSENSSDARQMEVGQDWKAAGEAARAEMRRCAMFGAGRLAVWRRLIRKESGVLARRSNLLDQRFHFAAKSSV